MHTTVQIVDVSSLTMKWTLPYVLLQAGGRQAGNESDMSLPCGFGNSDLMPYKYHD